MNDTRFKKGQTPHNKIEDVDHGHHLMYNRGCRCAECKKAWTIHTANRLGHPTLEELRILPCKECGVNPKMDGKGVCRECYNERARIAVNAKNRILTPVQYQEMFKAQGGVCANCQEPETKKSKTGKIKELAEDHIHGTTYVRGLLCSACNQGAGIFNDSPELLRKMADYIEHHNRVWGAAK